MNNFSKVVPQQWNGRRSNSRPLELQANALTIRLHQQANTLAVGCEAAGTTTSPYLDGGEAEAECVACVVGVAPRLERRVKLIAVAVVEISFAVVTMYSTGHCLSNRASIQQHTSPSSQSGAENISCPLAICVLHARLIACSTRDDDDIYDIIGPIPWGHSGPLCHALSFIVVVVVDIDAQAACDATVATPGEW